jgi:hypothetical protein
MSIISYVLQYLFYFFNTEWASKINHTFYNAFQTITDFGTCCQMIPYLDFENPETVDLDPSEYTAEHFHNIPIGAKNGVPKGIR